MELMQYQTSVAALLLFISSVRNELKTYRKSECSVFNRLPETVYVCSDKNLTTVPEGFDESIICL